MKNKTYALFLTRGALIAAMYVIFTILSAIFGLASGAVQLRISEAMCILPAFFAEAVPGLAIGCFLANLWTGAVIWDTVFGALATLIGAIGGRLISRLPSRFHLLIPLPTVIANTVIVPFVLQYAYGAKESLPFLAFTVGIGEILSAWVLGAALYYALKKVIKTK